MTLFSVCGFDLHIRSNPVEPQYIAQKIYGAKPATAPHPASLKGNAIYEISNTHPNLAGFCSRKRMLRQLELRPKHTDRIGLFRRDAPPEVELRFACQLPKPLQTPHNKLRALLLESLSAARFITPKWPHVAGPENVVRLPCPQSVTALLVECNPHSGQRPMSRPAHNLCHHNKFPQTKGISKYLPKFGVSTTNWFSRWLSKFSHC